LFSPYCLYYLYYTHPVFANFSMLRDPQHGFNCVLTFSRPWWLKRVNRLLCLILVVTTRAEWGVAERFASGAALAGATRPFVDVRSVPSLISASNHRQAGKPFIKKENRMQKTCA
jgi:hypothetical protein